MTCALLTVVGAAVLSATPIILWRIVKLCFRSGRRAGQAIVVFLTMANRSRREARKLRWELRQVWRMHWSELNETLDNLDFARMAKGLPQRRFK